MYKTGHAFTYLLRGRRRAARASDLRVVQSVVNHAIDEWCLSACVDAEGGHFYDCYSQNNSVKMVTL